jgi:hypothetical protein
VSQAAAQRMPMPDLNPTTYKSPSGKFSLTVEPTDPSGGGPANYRCIDGTNTVWSGGLPFTLYKGAISDTGVVAGYGYTHGPEGYMSIQHKRGPGDFLVVILDATGKVRLNEATKRPKSQMQPMHSLDDPVGCGLILDEANDRLIVRVEVHDQGTSESWWVYKLSTGKRQPTQFPIKTHRNPGQPNFVSEFVLDAKLIRGTSLILVHYWRFDGGLPGGVGSRFALIDLDGKTVWSKLLPQDYGQLDENPEVEKVHDGLRDWIRTYGGILNADEDSKFAVYFASEAKRVIFEVKRGGPDGWTVTEVAQSPFSYSTAPARPEPSQSRPLDLATVPERELRSLPSLVFRGGNTPPRPTIRGVGDFVIDGAGRLAFLREDDNQAAFVLVDPSGKVIRELPLNLEPTSEHSHWGGYGWVGGDFIVTRSDFRGSDKCRAWRLDMQAGTATRLEGFDCPPVERLAGSVNGSFVVFAKLFEKYTIEDSVLGFNDRAKRLWTLKEDFNNKGPERLFSVQDIALTTADEVAVLEGIINEVKFFDRDGKVLRQIDLEKTWHHKPNYVSKITRDIEGGVVVEDSQGSPPFVRMKRDGTVRGGLTPKFSDGRRVDAHNGIETAPDGKLWTSDSHSLLRLNESGVVDRVLGETPTTDQLGPIAGLFVDPRGRIYIVDSRTGSIHVFDATGQFSHVCATKPSDFGERIWSPQITFDGQSRVYLGVGNAMPGAENKRPFARFSEKGERQENVMMPMGESQYQIATGNVLTLEFKQLRLVDSTGKTILSILRGANGNWLEHPQAAAIAPNGAIAVLAHSRSDRRLTINLYKANGDPVRTILLPNSIDGYPRLAYDGQHVVLAADKMVLIFDEVGTPIQRSAIPFKMPRGNFYYPYILAGGRDLAFFDGKTLELKRYSMP